MDNTINESRQADPATSLAMDFLDQVSFQMKFTHVWSWNYSSYSQEYVNGGMLVFHYKGFQTRLYVNGVELAETGYPGDPFQVALALTARALARVDKVNEKFNTFVKLCQTEDELLKRLKQARNEVYELEGKVKYDEYDAIENRNGLSVASEPT